VSISPELAEALLADRAEAERLLGAAVPAGWPDEHDARFLHLRLDQMRSDPSTREWLVRAVVSREEARLVGHAGFHGPPGVNGPEKAGALEVGYTILPGDRGRGLATEAARALLDWAAETHGIRCFIASIAPDNEPSLAIARKLGFVQTGEQWDEEDGLELVFELAR
jgi:[ribosomal protein S5]-alanine N-acetyltransferase